MLLYLKFETYLYSIHHIISRFIPLYNLCLCHYTSLLLFRLVWNLTFVIFAKKIYLSGTVKTEHKLKCIKVQGGNRMQWLPRIVMLFIIHCILTILLYSIQNSFCSCCAFFPSYSSGVYADCTYITVLFKTNPL